MKRQLRRIIDDTGISLFRTSRLPVGTDYRKTIRNLFDLDDIQTVFDVGANVGQFCLHCSEIFRRSRIYSFEPINETFQILQGQTRKVKNIHCFNQACGDEVGSTEVFLQSRSTVNSLNPKVNVRASEEQSTQLVDITTIDAFCAKNEISSIDILKIDTEGFDLNVLKGARKMLSQRRIRFVLIEVTFDQDNEHNSSYQSIHAFLEPFGFKIHGFYNQSIHQGSTRMNYCDALFYLQP